ncbi:unnamed protein product, partial [marine sediment metagenome]
MTSHLYSIFTETSTLKILGYVIENPGREFIEKEIQKATGISKAGVNLALRRLAQKRLVERKRRGRMYFYTTQVNNLLVKQLKILKNMARLSPLVKKLKNLSQKIILFGSWSRGENLKDSDIDLCLLTNSAEEVQQIVKKSSLRNKLQLIIRTPTGFAELEKKDPVFFKEIDRGGENLMSVKEMFDLSGEKAIVTGAARGLGEQMALALAEAGADVAVVDVNIDAASRVTDHIRNIDRDSIAIKADVTK